MKTIFNISFCIFLTILPSMIIAQGMSGSPIMVVTCKRGGGVAKYLPKSDNAIKNSSDQNEVKTKQITSSPKYLKNYGQDCSSVPCPAGFICQGGICVPDCDSFMDVSCTFCLGGGTTIFEWDDTDQTCVCSFDGLPPAPPAALTCPCPPNTLIAEGPGGALSCVFPDCFDGEYISTIECSSDLIVDIEICSIDGGADEGSVVTIDALNGCDFASGSTFSALAAQATLQNGAVAIGTADANGCVTLQLQLDPADPNPNIDFADILDIDIPICPTASDPCICANLASNSPVLFSDVFTISGLPAGASVILDPNYTNSGFKDASGNLFPGSSLLGTASASGNLSFPFFRGPSEMTNIQIRWSTTVPARTGIVAFQSLDMCPGTGECDPIPESAIPTLSQWGIISLSLLLIIFGATRIKQEEKTALNS